MLNTKRIDSGRVEERTIQLGEMIAEAKRAPIPADVQSILFTARAASLANSVNILIFAIMVLLVEWSTFIMSWSAVTATLAIWINRRSEKTKTKVVKKVSSRAKRKLTLFITLSASPWALLGIVIFSRGTEFQIMIVSLILMGQMAGACFMLYRVFFGYLCYCGVMVFGIYAGSFLGGISTLWPIVAYATVYFFFLSIFAYKSAVTVRERDQSVDALSDSVAALEGAHDRISKLAYYDAVTGLPNRQAFTNALEEKIHSAMLSGSTFAIMMLDLDRFKNINDTMGHYAGDRVLALTAERLKGALRPTDVISRLGGDEFAVLVSNDPSSDMLAQLATRVIEALSEPSWIDGRQVFPGTSVGISRYPVDGHSPTDLMLKADIALGRIKEEGRGDFLLFDDSIGKQIDEHDWLDKEIRKALSDGDITVEYQPKLNIADNTLTGAEALVRWCHAERGAIAPSTFLPIAAERGMLPQITAHVLDSVASDILSWRRMGLRTGRISINLHPLDLKSPIDLLENMKALITRGVDPEHIMFEITEGCFLGRGTDSADMVLDSISDLGFQLSLDDFGTGYASFSHLRKLPVNEIKVDRSFVTGICDTAIDRAIISATIEVAQSIGLDLIAEGVETADQASQLQKLGIQTGQGYLWSPSLPRAGFEKFALKHAPRTRHDDTRSQETG